MIIYKIFLSYIGTSYEGWQVQPEPHLTVQGLLNKSLKKIFKSDDIHTMGSGRTDAGVHALEQVVKLKAPFNIPEESLKRALNSYLPHDIRVTSAQTCEDFHPTKDAKSKTYFYLFYKGEDLPPFLNGRATLVREDLNWAKIEEVSKAFIGEHDFINFSTKGTPVKSTIRKVTAVDFSYGHQLVDEISIESQRLVAVSFTGNGFLKQMIRLLVGALIEAGKGKISEADIKNHLICGPVDQKLGPVAPADGLYLKNVIYSP